MLIDDKSLTALDECVKQWHQIGAQLVPQLSPGFDVQEILQDLQAPILEAQRTIEKALEPIPAVQNRLQQLVQSIEAPHPDLPNLAPIAEQAVEFQKFLQAHMSPALEQLQRIFRELPPRIQDALLLLGEHGWYLDLEMPMPWLWEVMEALVNGKVEHVEEALVEYFEGRLEEIEKSVAERFPRRAHLIGAALNAHRRQQYELSIPVLLAQADGICMDAAHQYLFMKRDKRPRIAIYVDQIATDTYRAALLSPLAQTLPINASEHERPTGFDLLNRHTVLHGESLDYGSKPNGLKAISLLNYVTHVLEAEIENHQQDAPE